MKFTILIFSLALGCWACQSGSTIEQSAVETGTAAPDAPAADAADPAGQSVSQSGTFIYTEQEPGESHRLVIPEEGSREMPAYYGSESNSGEGIFFYAEPVHDMKLDAAGNVSFTIGERKLYAEPVADINRKPKSDSGFSRGELRYKGKFVPEGLQLLCESGDELCWADRMLFKRQ